MVRVSQDGSIIQLHGDDHAVRGGAGIVGETAGQVDL
jgi:hypothetical protein